MKAFQHPLLLMNGCLLGFSTGIVFAKLYGFNIWWMVALGLILLAMTAYAALRGKSWVWISMLLLFLSLGGLFFAVNDRLPSTDISHFGGQEVSVKGRLSEAPRITVDEKGGYKLRYTLEATEIKASGGAKGKAGGSGGLYVYAHTDEDGVEAVRENRIGDMAEAFGKVRIPRGYANPGQLDMKELLRSQGITATISAGKRGVTVTPGKYSLKDRFFQWTEDVRRHYRESMERVMPKADAAAEYAMLFGGYDGIKPELLEAFTITGIVHILSVSGSHISLIAAVMAGLAGVFRLPKYAGAALVLGTIAIYSVLSGCVPPVIRSAVMGGLAFISMVLGRERDSRYILTLTALAMLMMNPRLIFNISFQLSFLATAGLLYMAPVIAEFFRNHKCPRIVAMGISITISAQLSTLPVLGWYFNQLSLSSLPANLIVVPVVELMIVLGLGAGAMGVILPFFSGMVFSLVSILVGVVYFLTRLMAGLPGSMIWIPSMGAVGILGYYLLMLLLFMPRVTRQNLYERLRDFFQLDELAKRLKDGGIKKIWAVAIVPLFLVGIFLYVHHGSRLQVHFVDVGQGDCCLVITPHGKGLLFDSGGSRDVSYDIGSRVVKPYLMHYGIRELAGIFLTHCHEDHAAGAGYVVKTMPVGAVYIAAEGKNAYAASMRIAQSDPVLMNFTRAHKGDVYELDGVKVEVLYSPEQLEGGGTGNEVSNVYRIRYGDISFLITGDLTKENEAEMLADGVNVKSTVLKIGHHGSKTSSSEAFLQAVSPICGVFCVGEGNSFGHPKPEIVKRFSDMGIRTFRTDKDGAVLFQTDGKKLWVEKYLG